MKLRHAATIAAFVVAIPTAGPATASGIGAGAATGAACKGQHCFVVTITANAHRIDRTGAALVVWNCQAVGTPDAVLTAITTCAAGDLDAPRITLPGAYAATASYAILPMPIKLEVCAAGYSAFAENLVGGQLVDADDCKPYVFADVPL